MSQAIYVSLTNKPMLISACAKLLVLLSTLLRV